MTENRFVPPYPPREAEAVPVWRGLLSSDGELWRKQRRIVAASFTPGAVETVAPIFGAAADTQMANWVDGGTDDMAAEATATTMTIIADILLGGDSRLKTPEAIRNIAASLKAGGEVRLSAFHRSRGTGRCARGSVRKRRCGRPWPMLCATGFPKAATIFWGR